MEEIQNSQSRELNIARGNVKPAITFHQKISAFTLRREYIRPYNGKLKQTGHSFLKEVTQETEIIDHELALLCLLQLLKIERNYISKAVLVENITNTVIWKWYGNVDKYPYKIQYQSYANGDRLIREVDYYDWSAGVYRKINFVRDHFAALQEKVVLNFEWHKAQWREKALQQTKKELGMIAAADPKGAIEKYNTQQMFDALAKMRSSK